jgi:protein LTV1
LKPIGKVPGGVFVAATATTIDHQAKAVDPLAVEAAETRLNHATYDHLKATPDVDPAVLQALEALEDDAFVDEDAFEDDFIVKLDREETSIMASLDQLSGHQQRSRLDKDFANILRMYDEDGEGFEIEESYEEDEDVDVEGYENFSEASGPEGAKGKTGNNWHQLDEVRRELAEGDPKLLERILYTSDEEEEEDATKRGKKKQLYQIIDVDAEDVNRKELNCQTATEWMPNRNTFKPKIIRAGNPTGAPVEPIRISRKTGMPLESLDRAIPIPKDEHTEDEEEEEEEKVNKGEARKKDETAEEKRARKAAVKLEKKEKRISKKEMAAAAALQSRISA